ncbi:hypothetical protein PCE1_000535 [Barthelona sp. PCE]
MGWVFELTLIGLGAVWPAYKTLQYIMKGAPILDKTDSIYYDPSTPSKPQSQVVQNQKMPEHEYLLKYWLVFSVYVCITPILTLLSWIIPFFGLIKFTFFLLLNIESTGFINVVYLHLIQSYKHIQPVFDRISDEFKSTLVSNILSKAKEVLNYVSKYANLLSLTTLINNILPEMDRHHENSPVKKRPDITNAPGDFRVENLKKSLPMIFDSVDISTNPTKEVSIKPSAPVKPKIPDVPEPKVSQNEQIQEDFGNYPDLDQVIDSDIRKR